jgi:hypothetical protein
LAAAIEKPKSGKPAIGMMFLFGTPFDSLLAGITQIISFFSISKISYWRT